MERARRFERLTPTLARWERPIRLDSRLFVDAQQRFDSKSILVRRRSWSFDIMRSEFRHSAPQFGTQFIAKGITDRDLNGLVAHPPTERVEINDILLCPLR